MKGHCREVFSIDVKGLEHLKDSFWIWQNAIGGVRDSMHTSTISLKHSQLASTVDRLGCSLVNCRTQRTDGRIKQAFLAQEKGCTPAVL